MLALINLGSAPNDGTGDDARAAGAKINAAIEALNAWVQGVDGLTAHRALPTSVTCVIRTDLDCLAYVWRGTDLSAECALDPLMGLYVPPTGEDGSDGAWVAELSSNPRLKLFGGVSDYFLANGSVNPSPTDNTAAINALISACMYLTKSPGELDEGVYYHAGTINMGWGVISGDSFRGVEITGAGKRYRGEFGFAGTALRSTFTDRMAVNFQGGRNSRLKGVSLIGGLKSYIDTQAFFTAGRLSSPLTASNWNDPAGHANQDSRYAPHAAITVDGYSGASPSPAYPNQTFQPHHASEAQYNKRFSSNVCIEDVEFDGFNTGLANQPGDSDGNGDFTKLKRVDAYNVKYFVSIGNSQSRNVNIENCTVNTCYAVFTNSKHGKQIGQFGGAITDLSTVNTVKWFDGIKCAFAGAMTLINCYGEGMWQLGELSHTSPNEQPIVCINCDWGFHLQGSDGASLGLDLGVPAYILANATPGFAANGTICPVRFSGCAVHSFPSVAPILINGFIPDGLRVNSSERQTGTLDEQYKAYAHSALAGGLVLSPLTINQPYARRARVSFKRINLDTRVIGSAITTGSGYMLGSRANGVPAWGCPTVRYELDWDLGETAIPLLTGGHTAIDRSALSACTLTDRTLAITFSSRGAEAFANYGPDVGDVIVDPDTGMTFFVSSRSSLDVEAIAQNNYVDDGAGGFDTITPFSTSSGLLYVIKSGFYVTPYYLRGDVATGSAVISNCARDDGYGAWYETYIAADDWLYVAEQENRFQSGAKRKVASRDHTAGTITLSGNGDLAVTKQKIDRWIRKAAANAS